jgi:hypothetical protein
MLIASPPYRRIRTAVSVYPSHHPAVQTLFIVYHALLKKASLVCIDVQIFRFYQKKHSTPLAFCLHFCYNKRVNIDMRPHS